METPDWLNQAYVEQVLRQYFHDAQLRVTHCEIRPALAKGENFGGVLTRVKVTFSYRNQNGMEILSKDYLVKSSFEGDEFSKKVMEPLDPFNREMSIYKNVLPKLRALLEEINDEDKIFATTIHVDPDKQAMIFEDLRAEGFEMAERYGGLDLDHVQLILRKLAKYHATSAVLNEREKNSLTTYDKPFFNYYSESYSPLYIHSIVECGKCMCQWPEYERYGRKLIALGPHYMAIGKRCCAPRADRINVLAHGDIWTNNAMFRYDKSTGRPLDVRIIDFQYAFWGSPALDLHYFCQSSLKEPMRRHQLGELYQYYHKYFSGTLQKLNFHTLPIPTAEEFHRQVDEKMFYAVHSACTVQPLFMNENNEDADFNALMSEDERGMRFKRRLFENPLVQENLKVLVPQFDKLGFLEIDQP